MYSLTGTVCHSGGMSGGHYVAYVRVRSTQQVRGKRASRFTH
jgi:ubiquitin C-terminal hydrolase